MGNNQLNHWKDEYEKIPVPKETELRMRMGMKKAKTEQGQKVFTHALRNTGTVAAAVLVAFMVVVNTSDAVAKTLEDVPVLGRITRIVTLSTYTDTKDHSEAKVEIPKIEVEASESRGAVDAEVQKNYATSNEQIEAYAKQFISEYEAELKASGGEGNYALDSKYQVIRDDEKYLSIRIDTTVVMASGTQYVKIFNVNKADGKTVSLAGLFADSKTALAAISENIKQQMRDQMAQDDGKSYFMDSEMPETDFTGLTGEESFYFNDEGSLVIVFNEYEVAPGYMGAVEFTIPNTVTDAYR